MEAVSVLCQVQPQLRIANLYVKLKGFEGDNVECSVEGNSLSMEIDKMKMLLNFPKLVNLQDGSRFKAVVDDCYIHVRMPSGVPEGNLNGSDCTEVIQLPTPTVPHLFGTKKKMWIPETGVKSCLKCNHCSAVLVKGAKFDRVLPLPGDSWSEAASDWYCHLHGDATDVSKPTLKPRPTDCLFGSSFYALPFNVLATECQSQCFNCQATVARVTDDMVSFWCHAVGWFLCHEDESLEAMPSSTALEASYYALNEALTKEEESFFGRKLLLKSVTEALTIWLVGDDGFTMEGAGTSTIDLTKSDKRRVLFKFETQHSTKASSNINEYVVSPAMLHDIVDVLLKSTYFLPPTSRVMNDFSLGFLSISI